MSTTVLLLSPICENFDKPVRMQSVLLALSLHAHTEQTGRIKSQVLSIDTRLLADLAIQKDNRESEVSFCV